MRAIETTEDLATGAVGDAEAGARTLTDGAKSRI